MVVTGSGSGLGAVLARELRARSGATLIIADVDTAAAETVATEVGGLAATADVSTQSGVQSVVKAAITYRGRVGRWIANAGTGVPCGPFTPDVFDLMWRFHAMSIVWAAHELVPDWLARGGGRLVAVVSSNALTSNPVSMG